MEVIWNGADIDEFPEEIRGWKYPKTGSLGTKKSSVRTQDEVGCFKFWSFNPWFDMLLVLFTEYMVLISIYSVNRA